MNPDNGHLIDLSKYKPEDLMKKFDMSKYQKVPDELQHAAMRKLDGNAEAHVSLNSGGKLSQYCAKLRAEAMNKIKKRKAKTKLQKLSRKRNRK